MQVIDQVVVRWTYPTGIAGGPGYNVLYGPNLSAKLDSLRVFYNSVCTYMPTGMSIQILGNGVKVQDSDGIQVGDWQVTAPPPSTGTVAIANIILQTGIVVDWRTSGRNWRGRRVAGKSYLVPASTSVYTADGHISQTVANAIKTAADGWMNVAGANFGVWSRPVLGPKDPTTGVKPVLHPGAWFQLSSTNVPTKVVTLRSRRD